MSAATEMADIGDVRVEYCLTGPRDRPVVISVHGLAANLHQFREQQAHFSRDWRVLLVSLRGHGGSGVPERADRESYSLRAMAQDVLGLLDYLGIPAAHWVGNSMGGLIGHQVLQDRPERLLSLATFGIAAELHHGPVLVDLMTWIKDVLIRLRGYEGFCRMIGPLAGRVPATRERVVAMALAANPAAVRYAHMNVANVNFLTVLREATIPLLHIRGEYDSSVNRELRSTLRVLEQCPHARVVEMPEVGHYANLDRPEQFNEVLSRWYARVPGTPDGPGCKG